MLRGFASVVVLAGGLLLLTPRPALACHPNPCCQCMGHEHEDGQWHWTCCCWDEEGQWTGCEQWMQPGP